MRGLSVVALTGALMLLIHPGAVLAQEDGEDSEESRQALRQTRQTIAQYPEAAREALCAVAGYPELLVRLAQNQQESSTAFADLLDPYDRRDQEAIWNLARFPGLIDKIAASRGDAELDEVLAGYPEDLGATARQYAYREREVLTQIAGLHQRTSSRLNALLAVYAPQTQEGARRLLQYPELLGLLDTDLDQVILLGAEYRQAPDRVRQQLSALHQARPSRPAARARRSSPAGESEERESASQPPASRYDYDLNSLEGPADDPEVAVVYHHPYYDYPYAYPYPYWAGFPRWYGPAGWYAGFNWYLTPQVSATIGIEVPIGRRVVPGYRPYLHRHGNGNGDRGDGGGRGDRRGRRH